MQDQILFYRQQGMSIPLIAARLGVTTKAVHAVIKKHEIIKDFVFIEKHNGVVVRRYKKKYLQIKIGKRWLAVLLEKPYYRVVGRRRKEVQQQLRSLVRGRGNKSL